MPASSPLNVALVGYGYVGKTFHAPLIAATPGLALSTVVSSDPAKVTADFPGVRIVAELDAALADPTIDLVVVATPNALHAPQTLAALEAGKHVVVDKPFALTAAEARVMAAAARVDRLLAVFHNRRWDSDFLTLRRLIAEGTLGEIVQYESHFDRFRPVVRDRWRERAGPGAGAWLDLGPHLLDQALVLFGEPLAISADIAVQRPGAGADDYFHVTLRYQTLRVILHGSLLTAASDLRLAVHGTGGSFVKHGLDPQEAQLKAGMIPGAPGYGHDGRPGVLTTVENDVQVRADVPPAPADYRAFYAGVREAIVAGAPSPVPIDQALRVMDLLELAREASHQRRELAADARA